MLIILPQKGLNSMSVLVNSAGTWKDATGGGGTGITSGTATCDYTNYARYCKWLKAGNIVCVDLSANGSGQSSSTYSNITFTGLPKPVNTITLNYNSYTYYSKYSGVKYDYDVNVKLLREYSLSADGTITLVINDVGIIFIDHFVYISSE